MWYEGKDSTQTSAASPAPVSLSGSPERSLRKGRDFLSSHPTGDLFEVPGITAVGVNKLAVAGVTSTHQLLGKLLREVEDGRSRDEACDAMQQWLTSVDAPASYRSTVVEALASKLEASFPLIFARQK